MYGLILQNIIRSNTVTSGYETGVVHQRNPRLTSPFVPLVNPFTFYYVFTTKRVSFSWLKHSCWTGMYFGDTRNMTPTGLQSRRGQGPQELQLGLQGDPLLVNHLQTSKKKT